MKINRQQLTLDNKENSFIFSNEESVFFDIETTGFSTSHSNLYLIGCIHVDNGKCFLIQWLSESPSDEPLILYNFFEYINKFNTIIHFNGTGFDIPYLEEKCKKFLLPYKLTKFNSIDIYKRINKYKNIFKIDNLKQKTIEQYLGISRDDLYSGGELISIYQEYLITKDENAEYLLLQHNLNDLYGMVLILDILTYNNLFEGKYTIENIENIENDELIFHLSLYNPLPKRIQFGFGPFHLSAYDKNAYLKVKLYNDELKFYYPNYTDYYYLPLEDISIHKCVAFYVDKNFRTKAKAANCYSKKTGRFLPQYKEIISPYFKIEYNDKITYFEVTDEFLTDNNITKCYTLHVLNLLLNKK